MPAAIMPPEWIVATVAKRGNRAEENEDAVAAAPDGLRFAIADGATEGWESGPWAARLVAAYIAGPPGPADFPEWLAPARDWAPTAPEGPVPWYAAVKQAEGSFATLLGLELRRSRSTPGWAWRAVAVGDSCLLHVRGGALEQAVPLTTPGAFGSRPALVPSARGVLCPEPEWFAGRAETGDLFLLATDACAARLLDPTALTPALEAVHAALESRDPAALVAWCHEVQDTTNDDATVVAIRLPPAEEPS
jgi:hypothetical protein